MKTSLHTDRIRSPLFTFSVSVVTNKPCSTCSFFEAVSTALCCILFFYHHINVSWGRNLYVGQTILNPSWLTFLKNSALKFKITYMIHLSSLGTNVLVLSDADRMGKVESIKWRTRTNIFKDNNTDHGFDVGEFFNRPALLDHTLRWMCSGWILAVAHTFPEYVCKEKCVSSLMCLYNSYSCS